MDDIFIWAILCNKRKVAEHLWKLSDNGIAKALVARLICMQTSHKHNNSHYGNESIYLDMEKTSQYVHFVDIIGF